MSDTTRRVLAALPKVPEDTARRGSDTVLRFLWSIGQRADAEFYLQLFRSSAKESFAIIVAEAPVVRDALDALLVDLRFLSDLELTPVVVIGIMDDRNQASNSSAISVRAAAAGVPAEVVTAGLDVSAAVEAVSACAQRGRIPLVSFTDGDRPERRFARFADLVAGLRTRRVIFLQPRGGITMGSQRLGLVNVTTELPDLLASGELSPSQRRVLVCSRELLGSVPQQRLTIAITSPLNLLRELFTTSGAGTLLRRGSVIERHHSYEGLVRHRIQALLESAFGRSLAHDFFLRPASCTYVESAYRGAAILVETDLGTYMSKFAVEREAQGEGIGKDIWQRLTAEHARMFWRSRADNDINSWYIQNSDGFFRSALWHVFWRGIAPDSVPGVVAFSLEQPPDFGAELIDSTVPVPGVDADRVNYGSQRSR